MGGTGTGVDHLLPAMHAIGVRQDLDLCRTATGSDDVNEQESGASGDDRRKRMKRFSLRGVQRRQLRGNTA